MDRETEAVTDQPDEVHGREVWLFALCALQRLDYLMLASPPWCHAPALISPDIIGCSLRASSTATTSSPTLSAVVCGATLRVIACIESPDLIERGLTHLTARDTGGVNDPRAPPLSAP